MVMHRLTFISLLFVLFFSSVAFVSAATLSVSPGTGVYNAGSTFTARVTINTAGKPVNAAEGKLTFNTNKLSVVAVSRSSSIFNLWTQEPSFSNSAGTISFGGGSPNGYTGSGGTVMSVTFRALNAGNPKITFSNGSVLAADGLGTNILTAMNGASYTVLAPDINPEPEYIAPANTPKAPNVTSGTHPDSSGWYNARAAELAWNVPSDVTAIRTLLDESAATIPTIVYDDPVSSKTLEDLPEGISYFHIQFRNAEGWGKVTHYRLGVDTQPPTDFVITEVEPETPSPQKTLEFSIKDTSPITKYLVQIDGGDAIEYLDPKETRRYTLPNLDPGRHTVIVEAFDAAGNSLIATYAIDIIAFDKPVFTEHPERINTGVIPALRGQTRPNSTVSIELSHNSNPPEVYSITSNSEGIFTFIPDNRLDLGVYSIVAIATDEFGAMSLPSDTIKIIVEEPGYVRVGSFVVSILSIVVPLFALIVLLVFGSWYLWHKLSVWRNYVRKETKEAEYRLAVEFDAITSHLADRVDKLKKSRKGKLTKAETELIDEMSKDIDTARDRIYKEITDIDDVVE